MTSIDLPAALAHQLEATARHVRHDADDLADVRLTETFPVPIDEVWAALTDPARLPLWFSPVEGELGLGRRVRIAAMGIEVEILACEAPRTLTLSWDVGGDPSALDLQLVDEVSPHGPATTLSLRHHVHDNEHYRTYGPAATGAGWDGALLGLALHLADPSSDLVGALADFPTSQEGLQFTIDTCAAWESAHVATGADALVAHEAAQRTSAFYRGVA